MTRRFYSNTAPQRTLTGGISNAVTSCVLNSAPTGWPSSFPYFAALEVGMASMEIVSVTGAVGSTLTIVRGQGGTSAVSHASGVTVDHVFVAADLDEPNAHIAANANVHGVTGSVVGTTDAQTLSAKTLSSPVVTGGLTTDSVAASAAVASATASVSGLAAVGSLTVGGVAISGGTVGPLFPRTIDPLIAGSVVSANTNNATYYGRIVDPGSWSISTLNVGLVNAVGGGQISAALLRDNGSGAPGTLVAQSASTAQVAGNMALSLGGTFSVSRGDWFAVCCSASATGLAGVAGIASLFHPTWRYVVGTTLVPGALASNPAVSQTFNGGIAVWGQ